ncbi:hypothetical protein ACH4HG_41160, partial [Streptomyces coeruleorubidus]|uniref:hypothetical protein n=1 Tax=Streptomyces coeruleorubidus TaxID=116188 RepID=UPI0037A917E8
CAGSLDQCRQEVRILLSGTSDHHRLHLRSIGMLAPFRYYQSASGAGIDGLLCLDSALCVAVLGSVRPIKSEAKQHARPFSQGWPHASSLPLGSLLGTALLAVCTASASEA